MLIKQGDICKTGVYSIKSTMGKVYYIGGAKECNDAYSRHKSNLINGNYFETNKNKLQELFNREDLIFCMVKECKENELDSMETKYIKLFEDTIVNRDKKGKRRRSKPTLEETARRRKSNCANNNPNCKYELETIIEIKEMFLIGLSNTEISNKFGIDASYIQQIRAGRKWNSVQVL